ncbi:MAG: TetR/AcrR family transcriptional regulator [Longicatena sp.]
MKQAEKSQITYDKILQAAIIEFGTKSYDASSLNTICVNNNISKGLMYHNFRNKDALYLQCVTLCFNEITMYLSKEEYTSENYQENIKKLIDLRFRFFQENPYYKSIFFNSLFQPPKHLSAEIKQIRKQFDAFNALQYTSIIQRVTLREDISEKEALEYFFIFQDMFNGYFQSKTFENHTMIDLISDHEKHLTKLLNILLYGIAKEESAHA